MTAPAEPLRLSLSDLRSLSTKGKWWLVGSAWSGHSIPDNQADINASLHRVKDEGQLGREAEFVKLAKKQGMNTDVRKRVFVALMTGEVNLNHLTNTSQLKLD